MDAKNKSAVTYSGSLAVPVVYSDPPMAAQILGVDHPDVQKAIHAESMRVTQELLDKLPLLIDHFAIAKDAPDKWMQLAFRMARAHVPGFQTVLPKKSGAPRDWMPLDLAALHFEVELLIKQGMKAKEACHALVRLPDGSWRFPRSRDAKTLYRRYQEAKKSILVHVVEVIPDAELKRVITESIMETVAESLSTKNR